MKHIKPVYGKHYGPGYMGFSRPVKGAKAPLGKTIIWFISLFESASFIASHVFMVINEKRGVESAEKGVEYFNLQERLKDKNIEIVFRKPEELDELAIRQMFHQAIMDEMSEKPYDYTGLFGWVLRATIGLDRFIKPLRKLPVPLNFFGGVYCSAATARWLKAACRYMNWPLFKEWHYTRISPAKLWAEGPWSEITIDEKK